MGNCCICYDDDEEILYNQQQREDKLLMKNGTPLRDFLLKWGHPNMIQTYENGFTTRDMSEDMLLMAGYGRITKRLEYTHFTAYVKQLHFTYDNRETEYIFTIIPYNSSFLT